MSRRCRWSSWEAAPLRRILLDFVENLPYGFIAQGLITAEEHHDLIGAPARHLDDPDAVVVSHFSFDPGPAPSMEARRPHATSASHDSIRRPARRRARRLESKWRV